MAAKTLDEFRSEWYAKHSFQPGSQNIWDAAIKSVEENGNSLQQLKAEILLLIQRTKQCACADDMGSVKGLLEQIDAKLSAV